MCHTSALVRIIRAQYKSKTNVNAEEALKRVRTQNKMDETLPNAVLQRSSDVFQSENKNSHVSKIKHLPFVISLTSVNGTV